MDQDSEAYHPNLQPHLIDWSYIAVEFLISAAGAALIILQLDLKPSASSAGDPNKTVENILRV
jgi:hypothetical protein